MKKFLYSGFELLAYIAIAIVFGRFIDFQFSLKGWGTIASVFIVYFFWFLQFFKKLK